MKTLKDKVLFCLEEWKETRNSDIYLTIKIWTFFYGEQIIKDNDDCQFINLNSLYTLPTQEAIKRWRARIQSEGKFLPTKWEVAKGRKMNEDKWRKALGYQPINNEE